MEATRVSVIHLHPPEAECHICGQFSLVKFGIPIYEDRIVADDYQGEWGGVPVCPRCYYLTRGLQAEHRGHEFTTHEVRRLVHV